MQLTMLTGGVGPQGYICRPVLGRLRPTKRCAELGNPEARKGPISRRAGAARPDFLSRRLRQHVLGACAGLGALKPPRTRLSLHPDAGLQLQCCDEACLSRGKTRVLRKRGHERVNPQV